jgi:phosphoglycolate phosphatase-like HAD superfamily hydrolase
VVKYWEFKNLLSFNLSAFQIPAFFDYNFKIQMKVLLVFDIDDTLTLSVKQHHIAFRDSLYAIGVQKIGPTFQNYRHITDSFIAREIYEEDTRQSFTREVHQQFENELTKRIRKIQFQEVPGASQLLHSLQASKELAICFATGSFRRPAMHKLDSAGITYNEKLLVGADEWEEREQIVTKAIETAHHHYQVNSFERTIAIGDGVWDLLTAKNLGLEFIGVGKEHKATLLEKGATTIFEDLTFFEM